MNTLCARMLLTEICGAGRGSEKGHIITSFEVLEPNSLEVLRCYNNRRTRSKRSFGHSGSSTSSSMRTASTRRGQGRPLAPTGSNIILPRLGKCQMPNRTRKHKETSHFKRKASCQPFERG